MSKSEAVTQRQTQVRPRNDSGLTETRQIVQARGADWQVTTEWDVRGGRLEPVSVTIRALNRDRCVTGEAMRAIPIGELHRQARAATASFLASIRETKGDEFTQRLLTLAPGLPDLALGPRRGIAMSDQELEQVAAVYRKAWTEGEPVTEAVAEAFGISPSTASKRIMKARRMGLLEGIGRTT